MFKFNFEQDRNGSSKKRELNFDILDILNKKLTLSIARVQVTRTEGGH